MTAEREALAIEGVRFFGEMSASISHEIKNVLAIVNENAGLLTDLVSMNGKGIPLDPQRLARVAAAIARQVVRGDRIVKGMNRFAHSADAPRETVDLAEVLGFIPELAGRLIALKGPPPRIDLPDIAVSVTTNRFFLENLFWRCLCRAMNAALPERPLTITADTVDGQARIRFTGLDPAALDTATPFPDACEALVADLLDARLTADAATHQICIILPCNRITDG